MSIPSNGQRTDNVTFDYSGVSAPRSIYSNAYVQVRRERATFDLRPNRAVLVGLVSAGHRMRILHLVSSPERRGAQLFALQLADALAGDFSSTVVAVNATPQPDPLEIEVLAGQRWNPNGVIRLIARARAFDIVVGHGSSALIHGSIAAKASRRPFIYRNIGDPAAWNDTDFADARIGHWLRAATAVVSLYPGARDFIVDHYHVAPDRVEIIPNAIPAGQPPAATDRQCAQHELGLDRDRPWVALMGALTEEKQPLIAIRAVASLNDVGLVVAGAGPMEAECRRLASTLAPDRIRFLGVTSTPERVLATVDALVLPSRTEGVPAVAIEAGLSRLPVVASPVGGVDSVVVHGETGILVNSLTPEGFAVAIAEALRRKQVFGAAAAQRCEQLFTFESVAPQWAALIDRVTLY